MLKSISEVISDIYNNPEAWLPFAKNGEYTGIQKDNIKICYMGNTKLLSVIKIYFSGNMLPSSFLDKYRLEKACLWWFKKAPKSKFCIK